MGILSRFKDIMSANINALLDKAEDPEKMIDQTLRNLNSDLGKVKAETAAVMAEESRAKRELDEVDAEIEKITGYAQKAVNAGNDDDARQFLGKKAELVKKRESMDQMYQLAKQNSEKMRAMHDKLQLDIKQLESRKDEIKGKIKMAKAQQHINEISSSTSDAADSISAFERYEEKANKMLDEANAMAELNSTVAEDKMENLEAKYDAAADSVNADIEAELAAMKAAKGE